MFKIWLYGLGFAYLLVYPIIGISLIGIWFLIKAVLKKVK